MKNKEKNRLPLAPGDGSSPASSGVFASCSSLASVGLEVKENEDFEVFTDDSSKVLEDLQEIIGKKFKGKKVRSPMLSEMLLRLGYDKRAYRVADCGSFLEFHVFDDTWKLVRANFCRDRLCPMCNWRRSLKIYSQTSQVMDYVEPKGFQYLFLTLTLRNEPAERFSDMIQALFDGWRFLSNKNRVFKKIVKGALRFLEVTINHKDHTFHAHLHTVLAVRSGYFSSRDYLTQAQWTEMWADACGLDYTPIVHIEKFKPKPGSSGLGSAVAEACKYAMKDSDYLVQDDYWRSVYVETLLHGLSGRQLFGKTGCFREAWRDLKLGDPESGDLTDADQLREDLGYMVVRYAWRNGVYVRI